jgi:hypothetical protein
MSGFRAVKSDLPGASSRQRVAGSVQKSALPLAGIGRPQSLALATIVGNWSSLKDETTESDQLFISKD